MVKFQWLNSFLCRPLGFCLPAPKPQDHKKYWRFRKKKKNKNKKRRRAHMLACLRLVVVFPCWTLGGFISSQLGSDGCAPQTPPFYPINLQASTQKHGRSLCSISSISSSSRRRRRGSTDSFVFLPSKQNTSRKVPRTPPPTTTNRGITMTRPNSRSKLFLDYFSVGIWTAETSKD